MKIEDLSPNMDPKLFNQALLVIMRQLGEFSLKLIEHLPVANSEL
jgi:hypothetical protein